MKTIPKITEFPLKRFIYSFYSQSEIDHVVYGRDMKEEGKDTWWKENDYGVWKDFRNPKLPWTIISKEMSIMDCHHHGTNGYRSPWMCGDEHLYQIGVLKKVWRLRYESQSRFTAKPSIATDHYLNE